MRNNMGKKVLMLTGALGDGHVQAAKAVKETIGSLDPDAETTLVDFLEVVHPRIHELERFCFVQGVKHFPSVYTLLYQKTRNDNRWSGLITPFRPATLLRLRQLIEAERPDVVVSTFPPASAALSQLKKRNMTDVPTLTIITDHSDHSLWIHPHTDLYLVASLEVGAALQRKGVPVRKIAVTGIPIRPDFHRSLHREGIRVKLGLAPSSFVVLVMGGGCGMIRQTVIDQVRERHWPADTEFVFICGRNAKLQQRLTEQFRGIGNVTVQGFVRNIHEWMAAADVLVTKPGGLTTSEALAVRLPMILIDPKLGQERDNADYLVKKGAAVVCRSDELDGWLKAFMQNPGALRSMGKNAEKISRRHAAVQAVCQIMRFGGNDSAAAMGKMA